MPVRTTKEIPECCGKIMKIRLESPLYYEAACPKCGDVIYLKKRDMPKPQMLDD